MSKKKNFRVKLSYTCHEYMYVNCKPKNVYKTVKEKLINGLHDPNSIELLQSDSIKILEITDPEGSENFFDPNNYS